MHLRPLPSAARSLPAQEFIGRIAAIDPQMSRFKVGDIAGVGTMVDSCGVRANVGGVPETRALLEYCARNKIAPEVEVISVDQFNQARDRVIAKDVRYHFVIDMSTL